MCLAIPGKVIEINDLSARVEVGGNIVEANVTLVPDAKVGDYVLVHAGFAISKYDEEEALKTIEVLREVLGEEL